MNGSEGVPVAACTATLPLTGLSKLFGEHHRRVLTAAYRITGSMADAEDVTQAVFLRLASADGPVTNASSYLYRAAINGALDVLRQRKAAQTEPLEYAAHVAAGPGSSPETAASSRQLGALLRIAIGELPPRAAEMFILRYVEEHGNREIAALMGTSQAVVAVTLFNARSRLKKRLSEFERGIR
ncbi:MAG: RNA polymerase sigma factor [Terracidiphilus sp.]|jgi:RNA polymerase sigma-70 factor (ECF subfamily)